MIPKYLFHYTNINSLQKILQSQAIRFTRLDLLNDPYEGNFLFPDIEESQDEKRRLIYCSCWNAEENESINLWHIYTKMQGVRVKIKSSMFSKKLKLEEQKSGFVPIATINPIPIHIFKNMEDPVIKYVAGPIKIFYESSYENTYSRAIGKSIENKGTSNEFVMCDIDFRELGIRKIYHWQYEQEWRYKICPFIVLHASDKIITESLAIDPPKYIDVPFVEKIEERLIAPQITSDDYIAIISFMRAHKLNIPIKKSEINMG